MSRWETRILYPSTAANKTWTQPEKPTKATQVRPRRPRSTNDAQQEVKTVIYQRVQSTHDHKKDQLRRVVTSVAEQLVTELRQEIIQAVNLEGCSGSSDHIQEQEQTSDTDRYGEDYVAKGKSESAYASIRKRTTVDETSKQTETAIQATQERFKRCSNNPTQEDEILIYQINQSTHEIQEDRLRKVTSSEPEQLVVLELRQENIQAVNLETDSGSVDHWQEQKQASGKSFPFSSIASNATGLGVTPITLYY
ncbi:unnamed protein product [Mytilus coruscus]|uniref:Uncharacterized protein n=1 Tax=Mytilus coruscus TaxID=42192 RepID=A0A6J8CXD8_MYTCO|nr:unnamed protein product [Mytilus coruscus]